MSSLFLLSLESPLTDLYSRMPFVVLCVLARLSREVQSRIVNKREDTQQEVERIKGELQLLLSVILEVTREGLFSRSLVIQGQRVLSVYNVS